MFTRKNVEYLKALSEGNWCSSEVWTLLNTKHEKCEVNNWKCFQVESQWYLSWNHTLVVPHFCPVYLHHLNVVTIGCSHRSKANQTCCNLTSHLDLGSSVFSFQRTAVQKNVKFEPDGARWLTRLELFYTQPFIGDEHTHTRYNMSNTNLRALWSFCQI